MIKAEEDIKKERIRLMNLLLKEVGIDEIEDGIRECKEIEFNKVNDKELVLKYYNMIFDLKQVYPSKYLTSLHENSLNVQKFPGSNMLRQILRYNGYEMRPIVRSMGYKNKKKLVKRTYRLEKKLKKNLIE
jgi:hypothetical protein